LARRNAGRFRNELTTLPQYRELVNIVRAMDAPMTTAQLRSAAQLNGERDSLVGALWALEIAGEVHATRPVRNGLVWHRGKRLEPRPSKLEKDIAPFEHLLRTLREHGAYPFSTWRLIDITGLTRARALGALKASVALGLLAHRSDPIPEQRNWVVTWWWADATWEYEFDYGYQLSLDQTVGEDGMTVGDMHAAERVMRINRRGLPRWDLVDSSDGLPA
jgi:hypothetical protein